MGTPPAGDRGRRLAVPSPGALADRLGVSPVTVVLGALAVAAAAVGGWWALRAPTGPDPAEILPMAGSVEIRVPAPSPMPDSGRIVVDVVGAVARPGLHELPATSRVADAVEAAGGLTAEADRLRLNLAEPLSDGARLWVPEVGQPAGPEVVAVTAGAGDGGRAGAGGGRPGAPLNVNTADAAALEELPGIGPALAAAIVEHRRQSGPFTTVEELVEVSGIGPAKLERIRPLATVGTP
ncbi:MAG: ComEA family DNA-binding protein [Acidimicrobiaceae bacterium]|nr:ComEA family DNA-binding protein [Acidimicrobiaceae bacterium]MXZ98427.1 ComEA family DNA-binding protein [Acidimicrobiaceae bacterium]MYE75268.1 ComEA family DNA-binding protein [Acidimicrobiaceae bacterium]MYH44167.1 ComEA family DNA-binding protein [Acidimicrobiaceae bacterium]MYI52901.1 ComEA family DNA-binding protein [Acidimicrobiaceae bacterium]